MDNLFVVYAGGGGGFVYFMCPLSHEKMETLRDEFEKSKCAFDLFATASMSDVEEFLSWLFARVGRVTRLSAYPL